MSWKDCDEGFGAADWLKWDDAPFTVTFLGQPKFERKELHGKMNEQAIFTVVHEEEEKNLGLSKLAYRTFRELAERIGSGKLATTPIQCVRTGTGFKTKYAFNVANEDGEAPPPDDYDDIPF